MRKQKMKHTCLASDSTAPAGRGAFLAESIFYKYLLVKILCVFGMNFYLQNKSYFLLRK